jgi:16S rRNA (guanine966-N2)-methyltransferase
MHPSSRASVTKQPRDPVTRDNRLHTAPRQVRIVGGLWKRSLLPVPDVEGLRPTPDRVRETLFNWLQHLAPVDATTRGIDLFAGTGALGFELASRGAGSVLLVESHPRALEGLRATRKRLAAGQTEIIAGEALAVAAGLPAASFDVVFLDPPFGAPLRRPALDAARRLVAPRGWIYLETPDPFGTDEAAAAGLEIVRSGRAGRVAFHLLRLPSA